MFEMFCNVIYIKSPGMSRVVVEVIVYDVSKQFIFALLNPE